MHSQPSVLVIKAEKWHAYGNDFILVLNDLSVAEQLSYLARVICERHQGVGADGIVAYDGVGAHVGCRIFNRDGSEAEISGNGIRCLAGLLRQKLPQEDVFTIRCGAGVKTLTFLRPEPPALWFRADMGEPNFNPASLPANVQGSVALAYPLPVGGDKVEVNLVSVGNPHCVVFLPEARFQEWSRLGPQLESHRIFPRRANVEFVRVLDRHNIEVQMWERGVGKTFSSGTGACAAAVVSLRTGVADNPLRVHTAKGQMGVDWQTGQGVFLEGPAVPVWRGEFLWEPSTAG